MRSSTSSCRTCRCLERRRYPADPRRRPLSSPRWERASVRRGFELDDTFPSFDPNVDAVERRETRHTLQDLSRERRAREPGRTSLGARKRPAEIHGIDFHALERALTETRDRDGTLPPDALFEPEALPPRRIVEISHAVVEEIEVESLVGIRRLRLEGLELKREVFPSL